MKFLQGHFRNMWGISAKQIRLLLRDNDNFHKVLASKSACHLSHPSSLVLPKTLIFNIDSGGGRGEEIGHWVSLLMTKHGEALFFDSMGRQLHDVNIIKYLLPHYKYIFFNSTKIQHNSSMITSINELARSSAKVALLLPLLPPPERLSSVSL